jgi:RNA polymerase sigma-70 factor (ECF subfamily)
MGYALPAYHRHSLFRTGFAISTTFDQAVETTEPAGAREAQLAAALARCASGDRTALRVIYDLEAPRMIGVAQRIVRRRDLAEEAVHDAFMRIWNAASQFDPARGAARSWLYAVVRHRALTILRDEGRFTDDDAEAVQEAQQALDAADDACRHLPASSALRRCLEALEPKPREAVILSYVHGLSHGELAGRLRVPLGTAKSWTRRGLSSLQECIG